MKYIIVVCILFLLASCSSSQPQEFVEPPALSSEISPLPIVKVKPKKSKDSGWVLVEFEIDENGDVKSPRAIDSYPARKSVQTHVLRYFKKWKYHYKHKSGGQNPAKYQTVVYF